jgi:hypothetical protein
VFLTVVQSLLAFSLSTDAHRLSDNARAREALRQCLPEPLRDGTFSGVLRDDAATKRCLATLLINLSDAPEGPLPSFPH